MSLERDLTPDAANALAHEALERAAEVIGSCGIEVESLLLIVINKNDSGVNVCNAFQHGSVFSSIGAAQSWIIDNTRISN